MLNGKKPKTLSDNELLYRCVEQLVVIADQAKALSEVYVTASDNPGSQFTDEEAFKVGEIIKTIHHMTRNMDTLSILARLVTTLAGVSQSKTMHGATLTVSKKDKQIHFKGHYGPGPDDYHDMMLAAEIAKQLRDGLTEGLSKIGAESKLILPDNGLITH